MNAIPSSLRFALLATAFTALVSSASAEVLYSEDFNEPNAATPLSTFGWSTFSGGSPTNISINSSGTSVGAPFDPERGAFINVNSNNGTNSWFGGLRYTYASALPTFELSELSLTANVYGYNSPGNGSIGDVVLRIESSANNWVGFSIAGADLAANNGQLAGGLLSGANASAGTFDPEAASFNIVLAYANTVSTWGNDPSNTIGLDNVVLQTIPEPSTAALGAGLLVLAGAATARRRRNV